MVLKIILRLALIAIIFFTEISFCKSEKKIAADSSSPKFQTPQVLEVGDNLIGLRTALGDLNDGGPGLGIHYERQVQEFVSLSGEFYYSEYSQNVFGLGKYEYTSMIFVFFGSFHADLFKVQNLDTFLSFGIAHAEVDSEWKGSFGNPGTASGSNTEVILFATARYFFNSEWAVSASIGKGLNTLMFGIDYLF